MISMLPESVRTSSPTSGVMPPCGSWSTLTCRQLLRGVVGQADAGAPVPKAELAGRCLVDEGLDPARAVVVGDSDHDEAMAASWSMPFIALASGAGPLSHASAAGNRVELDTLSEIAAFVLQGPVGREP